MKSKIIHYGGRGSKMRKWRCGAPVTKFCSTLVEKVTCSDCLHVALLSYEKELDKIKLIDERIRELRSLKKDSQKWISVEDSLPEIGEEVLVYCPYKIDKGKNPVTALARYVKHEGAIDYYWDNKYGGANTHLSDGITHWMKLPRFKE